MEKRRYDRIQPLVIRTKFIYRDDKQSGYLTNLSEAGAFLTTEEQIPVGDKLTLRISLPWQIGEIAVEATVEWDHFGPTKTEEDQPQGVGLSFQDLTPAAKEKIEMFIHRFHTLVAQLEDQPS
jgi:Tfp pilus assembly protein PilZ